MCVHLIQQLHPEQQEECISSAAAQTAGDLQGGGAYLRTSPALTCSAVQPYLRCQWPSSNSPVGDHSMNPEYYFG